MVKNIVLLWILIFGFTALVSVYADIPSDALRGDVNLDGQICMDDSLQFIYHLWRDGRELPCPQAADLDCDYDIDVTDVIMGLRHIFHGDPITAPPAYCGY